MNNKVESSSHCENKMTPNEIFEMLRIPDAVELIPEFNGTSGQLHSFISLVDHIIAMIPSSGDANREYIISSAIRNKIKGPANNVLNVYGTSCEWKEIKRNLITHYSDKRNEILLIRDLHHLKQTSETIDQFHSKIIELLSSLNDHSILHESNDEARRSKQSFYKELCLDAFLVGLKEPFGSTIRAMRPVDLDDALSKCTEEQYIYYLRNTSIGHQPPQKIPYKQNYNNDNNSFSRRHNNNNNNNLQDRPNNKNYNQNNRNNYNNSNNNNLQYRPNNNGFHSKPNHNNGFQNNRDFYNPRYQSNYNYPPRNNSERPLNNNYNHKQYQQRVNYQPQRPNQNINKLM